MQDVISKKFENLSPKTLSLRSEGLNYHFLMACISSDFYFEKCIFVVSIVTSMAAEEDDYMSDAFLNQA